MSNPKKSAAETQPCPNCAELLPIPKSTRSFICRGCDAIIKVIGTDDGVVLKVVGKSVEDDPSYQAIEAQVAELMSELEELHKRYNAEMSNPISRAFFRFGLLGILALLVGLVILVWSLVAGAVLAITGFVLMIFGFGMHAARSRAFESVTGEMARTIERIGQRRDLLQRKAARMKVEF